MLLQLEVLEVEGLGLALQRARGVEDVAARAAARRPGERAGQRGAGERRPAGGRGAGADGGGQDGAARDDGRGELDGGGHPADQPLGGAAQGAVEAPGQRALGAGGGDVDRLDSVHGVRPPRRDRQQRPCRGESARRRGRRARGTGRRATGAGGRRTVVTSARAARRVPPRQR
ncbi:conserved hypothetical protein [Anaeromyxobacter dehalogenans 2CP-C]|uniref:Uncharacterized protein n=1 Tax=Anaeromyxobacter dehalogenans (strain 2CP-C) TaxID=290397 RepID=Q2INV1_ANADE|nr:conserved hypothetical protein [Anaeromyxobacter dehalogenans 2CP-C]